MSNDEYLADAIFADIRRHCTQKDTIIRALLFRGLSPSGQRSVLVFSLTLWKECRKCRWLPQSGSATPVESRAPRSVARGVVLPFTATHRAKNGHGRRTRRYARQTRQIGSHRRRRSHRAAAALRPCAAHWPRRSPFERLALTCSTASRASQEQPPGGASAWHAVARSL